MTTGTHRLDRAEWLLDGEAGGVFHAGLPADLIEDNRRVERITPMSRAVFDTLSRAGPLICKTVHC